MEKRLYKVEEGRVLAGVCGGVAEYLKIDPTIVRLLWVLVCLVYGVGIVLYIVAIFIMPNKSEIVKGKKSKKKKVIIDSKDED